MDYIGGCQLLKCDNMTFNRSEGIRIDFGPKRFNENLFTMAILTKILTKQTK